MSNEFVIGGSGWRYSPFIYVRTAGFSVDNALCLAATETSAAIETGAPEETVAKVFAAEELRLREANRRVISRADFCEALVWQNRELVPAIAAELARAVEVNNKRARSERRLFAMYIQRYTMKNDTIGFFGPACWGRLVGEDLTMDARPGAQLLRRRGTYFEHWAIRALANHLATDPDIRRALCPRLLATARMEGTILHYGLHSATSMPPLAVKLLALCDGAHSLATIIAELTTTDTETEVVEMLEELVDAGVVAHRIEIPFHPDLRPERALRENLEALPLGAARERALAELDELDRGRAVVAQSGGDPEAVARSFDALGASFERICKRSAHRRTGQMYAARELVYEHCVRDYDLKLGTRFVERLDAPLSLVLAGSRWSSWQVARAYRQAVRTAFDELSREAVGHPITALQLLSKLRPAFASPDRSPPPPIATVMRELDAIWARILALDPDERRATRSSLELRAIVEKEFAVPDGGFPHAQVHCPDLMIAAASEEAFRAGDYLLVLGEIHAATDTLAKPTNLIDHDDPDVVRRSVDQAFERPVIEWVAPDDLQSHVVQVSADPNGISIEMDPARSWRDAAHTFPIAELVAVEHEGEIRIRSLDGRLDVEAVDFASFELSAHMVGGLLMLGSGHWPRVTIDELVVSRERWSFVPAELPAELTDQLDLLRAFRAWARTHGIPRWIFLKTPEEVKPVYVDLESPRFLETASRLIRRASHVTITEMLPTPDQTWLRDASGARYTAELRMLVADPIHYKWR